MLGNRCKDRASGSQSQLNLQESLKFQRAFYRWLLFINLFPPFHLKSSPTTIYPNLQERFLSEFSYDEVVEMWFFCYFMKFVVAGIYHAIPALSKEECGF